MVRSIRNATASLTGAQSDVVSEVKSACKRLVISITNLNAAGGNNVYISVDSEASANKGVQIQPQQTVTWAMDGGYIPPQGQFTGYSAGATSLAVYEEIEVI